MGCCLSTTVTTIPTKSLDPPESTVQGGAKSPALVLDEQETVKEVVLSETQTPNTTNKLRLEPNDRLKEPVEEQEEISVVSEMHSISGSFSAATVNDGDEGGEVNQRIMHHYSPAKKRARAKPVANSRVITRGYKSPGPSSQVIKSRPAQGRAVSSTVQRRNVGQRSASEVIRHRRQAVSSGTGHPGGLSRVRKLEEIKRIEDHEGGFSRESLDNPRVSLECFIFL